MPAADSRELDIVLLGATGFTGGLTAEYLAQHAPPGLRWGIAGRNEVKLAKVREKLASIDSACKELPLLVADSGDPASLDALATRTRVLATTVGPYQQHGDPIVAACARAGTDYLDITGEPEFVDRTWLAHHETAVASGARLVHACGFDSVPHDLGARYTVHQLPEGEPITLRGVVRSNAAFSGGTFHSAIGAFARGRQMQQAARDRRAAEPRPEGRRSRGVVQRPHRDRDLGVWLVPLPTLDPFVVARSGAALERYGPDFRYSHYAGVKKLPYAVGGALGAMALMGAVQVPPLRRAVLSRIEPGQGPSPQRRAKSWFSVDFFGEAGGAQVHTRVSGGDPGYTETSKMLAEAALSLALDDNPETAGQVTTAVAMGENLTRRLAESGMTFEVVSR
ncbi:MAG: saccharopine dehydrogenase NADP-binding domain-containing protein [Nocardioides sp.]|nr:saccharopine dehydrogenase NADP-binding domain-containing protein [Nocardioides sp.]